MHFYFLTYRWSLAIAALLGLLVGRSAQAQTYNTGTGGVYNGDAYNSGAFVNTSTGTFTNSNSTIYYAGGEVAFTNNGTYTATAAATDQFIGPGGVAGTQELTV
ncbi:MAG: hypothetical protein ACRYFX_07600 [Janthinobacterium lividum]